MAMENQVVKVKRASITACMTCPLCNMVLKEATSISECLHTFCRACITEQIREDEIENCPTCGIDLGCTPMEKLRPDHHLQDLKAKIFLDTKKLAKKNEQFAYSVQEEEPKAPCEVPSVTLPPAKRKERSMSSLVVATPRVLGSGTGLTGKRTKSVPRKTLRGSSSSADITVRMGEGSGEDPQATSPETARTVAQNKKLISSPVEPSQQISLEEPVDGTKPWNSKLDLWKPLDCLVEAANRTKAYNRGKSHVSDSKSIPRHVPDSETQVGDTKPVEQKKIKREANNSADLTSSETVTPKKLRRIRRKRSSIYNDSIISPQALIDAASSKNERRHGPVWFSLVASDDQEGGAALPQIPANYMRMKDGNVTVSFIQKYLKLKLNLASDAEIEVRCMGQPVDPSMQLYTLIDLWLRTESTPQRVSATIGSSAKEYVMMLVYARRSPDPK